MGRLHLVLLNRGKRLHSGGRKEYQASVLTQKHLNLGKLGVNSSLAGGGVGGVGGDIPMLIILQG